MTREVTRDTVRVFGLLLVVPAAAAIMTLSAPRAAEHPSLELAFPAPTGRAADAAAILAVNGRVLALIAGATVLARTIPATAAWLGCVLTGVAALNVALISVAIASAGDRVLLALLPHAPLELLAYSLAAAGFLQAARNGTASSLGLVIRLTVGALALLALAAVLEVTPA